MITKQDMLVFKGGRHEFPYGTLNSGHKIELYGQMFFITAMRYEDERGRVFDGSLSVPKRQFSR